MSMIKKKCSLNASAINVLYCGAYKIWKTLEVTHVGRNQIKEIKSSILVHNYELFKMDDSNESASGSDEEVANICFMAHSDKEDEQEDEDKVTLESLSYHELFKPVDEMQIDLEKLSSKYMVLKKKYKTPII